MEAEGGQVLYRLKATVERTAFLQNIIKKQVIQVVRCMLPSEFDLVQSLEIHNTWAEKMMYDIVLPSKVYARGSLIPITFHITPIASRLRVKSLMGTLKEYCTYTANDCSKTDTRIVKLHKEEDPFNTNNPTTAVQSRDNWTKEIRLDIPPMSSQMAFCDADNEMIRIRHKLKFVICLVNADGHLSELRCSVPVIIISSISEQAELNTLPAYEQAWRSILCLESSGRSTPSSAAGSIEDLEHQVVHSSPMPMAINCNHTHDSQEEEEDDLPTQSPSAQSIWWNGENLSRVPSYNTAAQQAPVALSTSLPSYDQLSIGSAPRHPAMFGQLSMSSSGGQP